jgi:transposase
MPYSSSLTDQEWEIIEPLVAQEEKDKTTKVEQARNIRRSHVSVEEWL